MDKREILETIIRQLQERHQILVSSAIEARNSATNEESKAENKYDTRGLEASYLAGAQAERAKELEISIATLSKTRLRESNVIDVTSLVTLESEENHTKYYFLLPCNGGESVVLDHKKIMVISPEAPVAHTLIGHRVGDWVELKMAGRSMEYEVVDVC